MNKIYISILIACILSPDARSQQDNQPFHLSYFKGIPKVIDGCGGTYTYDTTSLKKEKYILITNIQELAIIRVNGKEISLHRTGNSQPAKDTNRDVYSGNGYEIIVILKEVRQSSDEETYEKGTLEIRYGKDRILYKIHGTAGC